MVNAVNNRKPRSTSTVPIAARSWRCIPRARKLRAASCALIRPTGDENDRSNSRRKLRRTAGLRGDVVFSDCLEAKSMVSKLVTLRTFPWSMISKRSAVRPRTGSPLRSRTVTGTSTRFTFTVSRSWAEATEAERMRMLVTPTSGRIGAFSLIAQECTRESRHSCYFSIKCGPPPCISSSSTSAALPMPRT